ncbi:Serine/threonine-protein phosphatase 4 regulatory subunit 3-like central domain-containing protein [Entamoeba marina]
MLPPQNMNAIFQILNHDPAIPPHLRTDFIADCKKIQLHQIVPYPQEILNLLEYIMHLTYLRDVAIARFLEELSVKSMTKFINNKRVVVMNMFFDNEALMHEILDHWEFSNEGSKERLEVYIFFSSFLQTIVSMIEKKSLFDKMLTWRIFEIVTKGLIDSDDLIRSRAADMLGFLLNIDVVSSIYYLFGHQRSEHPIMDLVVQFHKEPSKSLRYNIAQSMEILFSLEPFQMMESEKYFILQSIYPDLFHLLFHPLTELPLDSSIDLKNYFTDKYPHYDTLVILLFELAGIFITNHMTRSHSFIYDYRLLVIAICWLNSNNEILVTAILRTIKKIIDVTDDLWQKEMIDLKLFHHLLNLYVSRTCQDCLVVSTLSCIFEAVRNSSECGDIVDEIINYIESMGDEPGVLESLHTKFKLYDKEKHEK